MNYQLPLSRSENIIVQELKDEILVCDTKNNQVFNLNQTAGEIWKLCDGNTETRKIVELLSNKLKIKVSEELVLLALNELSAKGLLSVKFSNKQLLAGTNRREVIKRIGLNSMVALPLITSITMPTAINAQSTDTCVDNGDCFPLYCDLNTNTCQPRPTNCTTVPFQPNSCPPTLVCCGEGFQCSYGC